MLVRLNQISDYSQPQSEDVSLNTQVSVILILRGGDFSLRQKVITTENNNQPICGAVEPSPSG